MAEYIEREAAVKIAQKYGTTNGSALGRHSGVGDYIASMIDAIPAADVAPVVRCRDCKHCRELNRKDRIEEAYADGILWCTNQSDGVWPDDFCSYGERKEN